MSAAVLQEMPLDTQAAVNSGRDSFRPFFTTAEEGRKKKKGKKREGSSAGEENAGARE